MKNVYFDEYDEDNPNPYIEREYDGFGPDDRIMLDDPEEIDSEDDFIEVGEDDEDDGDLEYTPNKLLDTLKKQLQKPYAKRGVLVFRYDGTDYEGIPLCMINSNRFVFDVGDNEQIKVNLSDITLK